MADTCPYYHEHGTGRNTIPCCNHKHSPIPCFTEAPFNDGLRMLKCAGRLTKCEIPPYEQLDLS